MRRLSALAAAALVLAGCGSETKTGSAPPRPRLPHALAQSWARQANAAAAALAAGNGCAAQVAVTRLQHEVIAAVNARRIPQRLLEPLSSGVNDLAAQITCTPPPPTTTAEPQPRHGKAKGHGKDHGHDHGQGDHGD